MEFLDPVIYFLRKAFGYTVTSAIVGSLVGGLITWYIVSWDRAKNNEENRATNFQRGLSELKGQYRGLAYVLRQIEEYKLTQKILICAAENQNYKTTFAPIYTLDNIKNQSFLINQLAIRRIEIEANIDRLVTYLISNIETNKDLNPDAFDLTPLGAQFKSFNGDSVCSLSFEKQQQFQRDFRGFIDPKVLKFLSPLRKTISDLEQVAKIDNQ